MHFGSLLAALGSYLDARAHDGSWLLRIEDLDTPRCSAAANNSILAALDAYGLHHDETILYQSQRMDLYEAALAQLKTDGQVYPCACSRKEIADSALPGVDGPVYPGTCRGKLPPDRTARAWRVRTDDKPITFCDRIQGTLSQRLESGVGDFVVKRADDLFAYQLAVTVDDALQGITHIVRGADLLDSTPRQLHLQHLLHYVQPDYMHLPVATNHAGEKLSKQTRAPALPLDQVVRTLHRALTCLRQSPPPELLRSDVRTLLDWGIAHWQPDRLCGVRTLPPD